MKIALMILLFCTIASSGTRVIKRGDFIVVQCDGTVDTLVIQPDTVTADVRIDQILATLNQAVIDVGFTLSRIENTKGYNVAVYTTGFTLAQLNNLPYRSRIFIHSRQTGGTYTITYQTPK